MIAGLLYSVYTTLFQCRRECLKFFFQEDEPRKTLDIVFSPPSYPWVYVSAVWSDGEEEDVTDIITPKVLPDELLTPARLLEISGLVEEHNSDDETTRRVVRWEYMSSQTFEVSEITSEGLLNAVKPKID